MKNSRTELIGNETITHTHTHNNEYKQQNKTTLRENDEI